MVQPVNIKRFCTIAKKMRLDPRIRMHRSRASGASNLLRYGRFCTSLGTVATCLQIIPSDASTAATPLLVLNHGNVCKSWPWPSKIEGTLQAQFEFGIFTRMILHVLLQCEGFAFRLYQNT